MLDGWRAGKMAADYPLGLSHNRCLGVRRKHSPQREGYPG